MMKQFMRAIVALGALAAVDAQTTTCADAGNNLIGGVCVCKSAYAWDGSQCAVFTTTGCAGAVPTASPDSATTTAAVTLADNAANTADTLVAFTVKIPMVSGRKFTDISILPSTGVPQPDCSFAAFDGFSSVADQCKDSWTLQAKFTKLLNCGFATGVVTASAADMQRFDGVLRVSFTEPVTLGTDGLTQAVDRTSQIDFPAAVELKSTVVVPMSVDDVRVFAQQKVDIAIRDTVISKDPNTPPSVTLTYAIQYPYDITAFGEVTVDPTSARPVETATKDTSACTYDPVAANSDYKGATASFGGTCTKTASTIVFDNTRGTNCKFNGETYTLAFTVGCGASVPTDDCPIADDSTDNSVTFSLTSEDFCAATVGTIGDAINIDSFEAVSIADGTSPKTAWRFGDKLLFRMKFSGLLMQSLDLVKLERYYSTTVPPGTNTVYETNAVAENTAAGGITGTNLAGFVRSGEAYTELTSDGTQNTDVPASKPAGYPVLGLVTEGTTTKKQAFNFVVVANDALLGASPARGVRQYLKLKATIQVSYDRGSSPAELTRRRRRQVTAGQGVAQSETQSIEPVEDSAAAPNSAVRAAPAVALVLALLSVVALL